MLRPVLLSRRSLVASLSGLAASALGCSGAAPAPAPVAAPAATDPQPAHAAVDRIAAIGARLGGRLGVYAFDTGGGFEVAHRAAERFAMCSTFKAPLVARVLAGVDRGELSLDQRVPLLEADLLGYAPVARARVAEGALSLVELCAAAIEVSDNTAANLLLDRVGGPAGFTAFVRSLGDSATRLDRNEPTLNTNLPGDPRDTTTPAAMAHTFGILLTDPRVLSAASRTRFIDWLIACKTGNDRLRAGLPAGARVGDKTGTSDNGACNDVAVVWLPSRAPIVIACYVDAPRATDADRNAAHADVARAVMSGLGS